VISSNLGRITHPIATLHPWRTTTTTDRQTDRQATTIP